MSILDVLSHCVAYLNNKSLPTSNLQKLWHLFAITLICFSGWPTFGVAVNICCVHFGPSQTTWLQSHAFQHVCSSYHKSENSRHTMFICHFIYCQYPVRKLRRVWFIPEGNLHPIVLNAHAAFESFCKLRTSDYSCLISIIFFQT